MTTRLTADEYVERIMALCGVHPDESEFELEKRRRARDALLDTVSATWELRLAEARGEFPTPAGLTDDILARERPTSRGQRTRRGRARLAGSARPLRRPKVPTALKDSASRADTAMMRH